MDEIQKICDLPPSAEEIMNKFHDIKDSLDAAEAELVCVWEWSTESNKVGAELAYQLIRQIEKSVESLSLRAQGLKNFKKFDEKE